jgi:hypothetical protein
MSGSLTQTAGDTHGHFAESDAVCPEDANRHTMCPSIILGTIWQRTLEAHDAEEFDEVY